MEGAVLTNLLHRRLCHANRNRVLCQLAPPPQSGGTHPSASLRETWRDYRTDLFQFAAVSGDCPPGAVTFHDVDCFVAAQTNKGFQPATVNRRLAAITAFYTFLADEDPILVCPVLPHRHNLRERQRLPRPVQEEGLARFFAVVDNTRDLAMFLLMLRCGLRIGEVAALRLADLYLPDAGPSGRCGEPSPRLVAHGKGSRDRSVYLSPQAERAFRAYLAERRSVPLIFRCIMYQEF